MNLGSEAAFPISIRLSGPCEILKWLRKDLLLPGPHNDTLWHFSICFAGTLLVLPNPEMLPPSLSPHVLALGVLDGPHLGLHVVGHDKQDVSSLAQTQPVIVASIHTSW